MELNKDYRLISNWFRKLEGWNNPVAASFSGPEPFVIVIWDGEDPIRAFLGFAENEQDAENQFMQSVKDLDWVPEWTVEVYPFNKNEILDLYPGMFTYVKPLTTIQ